MLFFSVITVASNNSKELKYTGRSLNVQMDAPEFEWLVVGSLSPELAEEFAELNPVMVDATFQNDTDAMNAALTRAQGEYVWFLPAGACLADAFVMRDVKRDMIASVLPDFFYGASREDGHIRAVPNFGLFSRRLIAPLSALLFRRRAIADERFDPVYGFEAAYDFTLRFINRVQKIGATERILTDIEYRIRSIDDLAAARAERFIIRQKHLRQFPLINKTLGKFQALTENLKHRHPKLFWKMRDVFAPVPKIRAQSFVKGGYKGIFFKKRG